MAQNEQSCFLHPRIFTNTHTRTRIRDRVCGVRKKLLFLFLFFFSIYFLRDGNRCDNYGSGGGGGGFM
jgi:hypothetical protein